MRRHVGVFRALLCATLSPIVKARSPLAWLGASAALGLVVACSGDPDVMPIQTGNADAGGGGSSGGGGSGSSSGDVSTGECDISGDTPCQQCTTQNCRAEAEKCYCTTGADTCRAYFEAELECLDLPDAGAAELDECVAQARTAHPQGSADSQAYDDCQAQKCASTCGL